MSAPVHILILAAGASSRMGGLDKLLQPLDETPLLRRVVAVALATAQPVTVVLSPAHPERQTALQGLTCKIARAPDAAKGMAASLRRGLMAVRAQNPGPRAGLMVLPADMPLFTTPALAGMVAAFAATPDRILRGVSAGGQPGHPVIFPRDLWPALETVTGDQGGTSVLTRHADRVQPYALPGEMAVCDLDTPEDWAAFRALHGKENPDLMRL